MEEKSFYEISIPDRDCLGAHVKIRQWIVFQLVIRGPDIMVIVIMHRVKFLHKASGTYVYNYVLCF